MTGHVPGVVLVPTFHVQLTTPFDVAVLAPRPAAVEDPDLYWTSIEHAARAAVFTLAVAFAPRLIGDVNFVNASGRVGSAVALGVGAAVGSGVGSGVSCAVGSGVGSRVGVAVGPGVGVNLAVGVGAPDSSAVGVDGAGSLPPWFPLAITDRATRLAETAPTITSFWRREA